MPKEPPPASWELPDPRSARPMGGPNDVLEDVPDDVIAVGGDLSPGNLLSAYRHGMFPMHLRDGRLAWWSPVERGILPVDGLRVSRSLKKSARRYRITVDQAPVEVVEACADPSRPHGWINDEIKAAYLALFKLGWMHTVEAWDFDGNLVGGLYGVGVGGFFGGESMFSRQTDASKSALVHLVGILSHAESVLLDVQWVTPHLETFGAVAIPREEYLSRLPAALAARSPWD